ncbi:MAG: shikimate dehydrogenase [Gallionellales bacterium RIFCSPHIGHO2_02_FULL_57_16]|nr:MAG: shikimate dehydrogenase [Gallionellales bacterium RIFCSPHIGHO2_02_FULL_57_16]
MTDKYAVIGNPIAHSKSPQIHKLFAQQTGQDISYEAILAPLDDFVATVERLRKEGYKGCNVTVPFKFEAFKLATKLSERAQSAQTVNTFKFEGNALIGDNTDGVGLVRDIENNLGFPLKGLRVLLMGAGGATYGAVLPLLDAGVKLGVVNRTIKKAQQLGEAFAAQGHIAVFGYADLDGLTFDCIINATSSGLSGEMPPLPSSNHTPSQALPLSPPFAKGDVKVPSSVNGEAKVPPFVKGGLRGIFAPGALAYDMMYGRETPFMKFAREQGAAVVSDGLGMLVEQAAESFYIWRGVRPETAPVIAVLRTAK